MAASPRVRAKRPLRADRRQKQRRDSAGERSLEPDDAPFVKGQWFPARWPYLILAMLASIGAALAVATRAPSWPTVAMFVLSIGGVSCLRRVHDEAMDRTALGKSMATALAIVLPLFLFGVAMTRWAHRAGLEWDIALAAMVCVSGLAAVYLRRQPGVMFAAFIAIWSAAGISHASLVGIVAMLVGLIAAVLVSREELAQEERENAWRDAQERIRTRAQDILADYEETGQGWFWETDRRSQLTYVSPAVADAIGAAQDETIGRPLTALFDMGDTGREGERTLMFHLSARSAFSELAVRAAIADEERWWSVSGRPIYDRFDNFVGFRGSGTDLTERKRSQENASRLAHYDSLTGLANRFHMSRSLETILGAPQEANRACAVMLLDLDRFKQVNDTLGHPVGDELLKQVAQRLERAVAKRGQVGRLGGDEFKVIVPTRVGRKVLAELGQEIIHSLSQPYSIDGNRVTIGASVGIALSPDHGTTSEELIRNADLALYAAKDGGRGRYHFYATDLHADAEARAEMEGDLRDAIAKGELQLFYQPVVASASEQIAGFEALMRWHHPVKGWIPPNLFIESAEETGLIQQMGDWALRQACEDVANWPESVRVAVNVSPIQFSNPQLPAIVTGAVSRAGIDPSRLELEITESVFLNDDAGTDAMFAALKGIGVRLALDDFGTGYSSLGYLKKAPFDKIKIDQSFVRGATEEGSRNRAIIASITSLAHALGMDTTAEGVETLDELDLVRMHGCSHVQGFIYERPLSFDKASELLSSGLAAVARGPQSSRAPRNTMLRKVVLDHQGQLYNGTIRNLSVTGALIEGLWNVPKGTIFKVHISQEHAVTCTARWSEDDRMGVEFAVPLSRDHKGGIAAIQLPAALQAQAQNVEPARAQA
ncbi:EAL domain-containing protein [Aurantiacibacter spongiae]|uniref:EAL domain-containing protein n=2 Tax=Aurantiacibacter spongiae TaxID=2488860 RepID=A0A3N5CY92_9SPHN|nr:EAL domain-containing protein [Aurantiacibacter spongiae]